MEDFELHRVKKKLEEIELEHQQLNHQILNTRRNEQFEREMLQRRFDGIIGRLETRRVELEKEKKNYERQLERIEVRLKDSAERNTEDNKMLSRGGRSRR